MATVRRYGPSLVKPEVAPTPVLGRGAQQSFEVIKQGFDSVNQFLRPAVEKVVTDKGLAEGMAAAEKNGPKYNLKQVAGTGGQTEVIPADVPAASGLATQIVTQGRSAKRIGQPSSLPTGGVYSEITDAANRYGVDPLAALTIAKLESGFDPNAKNPNSSASGLFQFIKGTAQQYGLQNPFSATESADAGARLTRDGTRALANALGRAPTVGEVYLAHQQGIGGAKALLTRAGESALAVLTDVYNGAQDRAAEAIRLNGGNTNMTAGEFAQKWTQKAEAAAAELSGGQYSPAVMMPTQPEYELEVLNGSTFEPRLPFTVRDAAFNSAADRVLEARASEALQTGMAAATQRANGDLGKLREELDKVRSQVIGSLPESMPALKLTLEQSFARNAGVATRGAVDLMQRRVMAEQEVAKVQALAAARGEAERLALTGAGAGEIASSLSDSQDAMAAFGPREGFVLNGKTYPPDPTRAGIMTAAEISSQVSDIGSSSRRMMIEAEFERSQAPGQFADEFRRQVMSGNSPLPVGESLDLMRSLDSRAAAAESARRAAANADRKQLETETETSINAYVTMGEAGVPVAVSQQMRAQILNNLSPYPDMQRKAELEFAVADAAVATHGMSGPELVAYSQKVQGSIVEAAKRGAVDFEAVAVVQSLQDRVKKVQDAVTAEMIGLPMIEQLAMDGATADDIDWQALRDKAAGKPELVQTVSEVEAFYRDIESLDGMTAAERDDALEAARQNLGYLAAKGGEYGAAGAQASNVLNRLQEWSEKRADLAKNDATKYAQAIGLELPSMEGVQTMGEAGSIIAQRVALLAPRTEQEGVKFPVPLTAQELTGISEVFKGSGRSEQAQFLASVSDLGRDQADAIFSKIGRSEPALFAAGAVYSAGNQNAAMTILRGAADVKVGGGSADDVAAARMEAIGDLLESNMIAPDGVAAIDAAALAYARGAAVAEGGREMTVDDLTTGYQVALGQQEDGSGGPAMTSYGPTILPKGWTASKAGRAIGRIDEAKLSEMVYGKGSTTPAVVTDGEDRAIPLRRVLSNIEALRPVDGEPGKLVPLDADGRPFKVNNGPLIIDMDLLK